MIPFEYLEHTADVMFRAYGRKREEMLENAALALFRSMIDPGTIELKECWEVELEASDLDELAYNWLSEIVFLFETESAVFGAFSVQLEWRGPVPETETDPDAVATTQASSEVRSSEEGGIRLRARIQGERIDLRRHAFENEVKAITRHRFAIRKNELWCIQVLLDV